MSHSVSCDKMRTLGTCSYEELYGLMKQEIDIRTCSVDGLLMDMKEEISIRYNAIMYSTFSQQEFPRMKKELESDLTKIFNPLKEFLGLMERRLVQKGIREE